jgi:hypothetical protein
MTALLLCGAFLLGTALSAQTAVGSGQSPPALRPRVALGRRPPPPDNFLVEGKVTAVDAERQTFTAGKQRVQVTPDTLILIRKGFGSFKDIQVGRRVRVEGDGRRAARVTVLGGR